MMNGKTCVMIGAGRAGLDEHPYHAGLWRHPGLRREQDNGKHGTRGGVGR